MDFLGLPLQLQVADKNPTPGPSSTGLLALPPPEVNRKRFASRSSEEEENNPPKQMKLFVADARGGPPKPDFKERVISHAHKDENGSIDDVFFSVGLEPSLGCGFVYDAAKDRLSFANVEIYINKEDRKLQCGACGQNIKQNVKTPGEFYKMERNMKKHVLHMHFNVWELKCNICGKGFAEGKQAQLEKHLEKGCPGSVQSGGQIDQAQISTAEVVTASSVEAEDEKMEEDDDMLSDAKGAEVDEADDDETEGEDCTEESDDDEDDDVIMLD